jgi:hypothetical protein
MAATYKYMGYDVRILTHQYCKDHLIVSVVFSHGRTTFKCIGFRVPPCPIIYKVSRPEPVFLNVYGTGIDSKE